MRKPEVKPTIRTINQHLVRFERTGLYTTPECIKERGNWIKLMSRRPKQSRS